MDKRLKAVMEYEAFERFKPHVDSSRRQRPPRVVKPAPAGWLPVMMPLSGAERVDKNYPGTVRDLHAAFGGYAMFLFEVAPPLCPARRVWGLVCVYLRLRPLAFLGLILGLAPLQELFHGILSREASWGGLLTSHGEPVEGIMMPCPWCLSNKHVHFKINFSVNTGHALHGLHGPLTRVGRHYQCQADHGEEQPGGVLPRPSPLCPLA